MTNDEFEKRARDAVKGRTVYIGDDEFTVTKKDRDEIQSPK